MRVGRYLLALAGVFACTTAVRAVEQGDGFECSVVEFHYTSPVFGEDAAFDKEMAERTYTLVVGSDDITVISKSTTSRSGSTIYQIIEGGTVLETAGMAFSVVSLATLVITNDPADGYDGAHAAIMTSQLPTSSSVSFLKCVKF